MPLMVNKLIFTLVPSHAPFLIRPLVSSIFGALTKQTLDPELNKHMDYISSELNKAQGDDKWFAGGDKDGNPVCMRIAADEHTA